MDKISKPAKRVLSEVSGVGLKIELEFREPPQVAEVASIEARRRARLGASSEPPR